MTHQFQKYVSLMLRLTQYIMTQHLLRLSWHKKSFKSCFPKNISNLLWKSLKINSFNPLATKLQTMAMQNMFREHQKLGYENYVLMFLTVRRLRALASWNFRWTDLKDSINVNIQIVDVDPGIFWVISCFEI